MNEITFSRNASTSATAAIVGLNAALAVGHAIWPAYEPVYEVRQTISTFSFFDTHSSVAPASTSDAFAKEVASIFASLSEGQTPLGADFEAIWDANVDDLYQS